MNIKARINQAYKKLKLDRCQVCIGQALKTVVVYAGDLQPAYVNCERCGRSLLLIINVVYVAEPPPAWFLAEPLGIDTDLAQQQWQEYLAEFERQYLSRHTGPSAL